VDNVLPVPLAGGLPAAQFVEGEAVGVTVTKEFRCSKCWAPLLP